MLRVVVVGHVGEVVPVEIEFNPFGSHAIALQDLVGGESVGDALAVVGAEDQAPAVGKVQRELVVAFFDEVLPPERGGDDGPDFLDVVRLDLGVVTDHLAGHGHRDDRRGKDALAVVRDGPGNQPLDVDIDGRPAVGRCDPVWFGLQSCRGERAQEEESENPFHNLHQ